ncbi:unnamed protein product [Dovyalis caffra]|uniref:PI3K/PI4K catalytic domain-containing protein n=1 Tax=Dovyalis caffra TaxID=77055 RepID=A0AAV1SQM2_9ROSI|nr:unnamed protein product [Dovyalis caffra]
MFLLRDAKEIVFKLGNKFTELYELDASVFAPMPNSYNCLHENNHVLMPDIFQEAGLPLWLRPYEVLCTSSYTALIETIPDTASIHSIKSRYPNITSLRDFFVAKYGEDSPSFKLAQDHASIGMVPDLTLSFNNDAGSKADILTSHFSP